MQQENRWRILWPGLSVKDRDSIYLCRAIKSRMFHGVFLSLSKKLKRWEHYRKHQHDSRDRSKGNNERSDKHSDLSTTNSQLSAATSKMISSSTGTPSGRLATP